MVTTVCNIENIKILCAAEVYIRIIKLPEKGAFKN
jgi:hypothetical protein